MKTILLILLLPTLTFCQQIQKVFTISTSQKFRIYVDSQSDKRTYLNVYEQLPKGQAYKQSFRRYEIQSLEPVSNGIVYYLSGKQYCFYNQIKGEGKICEERQEGYKCKTWTN